MTASWPSRVMALPLRAAIIIYRYTLSPFLGANCRFQPTCSAYCEEALKRHGAFRGTLLCVRRIGRCHPWGGEGYDPVPDPVSDPVNNTDHGRKGPSR